jgi:hypothetical protein
MKRNLKQYWLDYEIINSLNGKNLNGYYMNPKEYGGIVLNILFRNLKQYES